MAVLLFWQDNEAVWRMSVATIMVKPSRGTDVSAAMQEWFVAPVAVMTARLHHNPSCIVQ